MLHEHTPEANPWPRAVYQIRIKGHLGPHWADWFGDLAITLEDTGETLLTGPVADQAALYGLLRKVRNLGMPLLSVRCVDPSPAEASGRNGYPQDRSQQERNMPTHRTTAAIVGILFIAATAANLMSASLTRSLVTAPDYLKSLSASGHQVLVGALFALIAALASASIAIALYPVLRRYNEGLALGAMGFRLIESVFYIVDIIGLLSLLALSQAFVKAGAPSDLYFQTISTLIQAGREWANFVFGVSAFSLGALMYYAVMYQSRIIPRWLAAWGVLGAASSLGAAVFILFGLVPYSPPMLIMILPIATQEMALAIWLIVKGFGVPSSTSGPTRRAINKGALS